MKETGIVKLVFASDNVNKLNEIRKITPPGYNIISKHDAGVSGSLAETGHTLADNAAQKAMAVYDATGLDCFADDSGLEVEALQGRPGVYSARYAGPGCSAADNIRKLLIELEGLQHRHAVFRTVIALVTGGRVRYFEGSVSGRIASALSGKGGFGYDPVFIPDGFEKSFAEMPAEDKNRISHRGKAVRALAAWLAETAGNKDVDNTVD